MAEAPAENTVDIATHIVAVRNQRVLLDETLATLYGVPTRGLNQAVRRNRERFPADFLIELRPDEWEILRSQIVILRSGHGRHADTRRQFDQVYEAILGLMAPLTKKQ